eukprot:5876_1
MANEDESTQFNKAYQQIESQFNELCFVSGSKSKHKVHFITDAHNLINCKNQIEKRKCLNASEFMNKYGITVRQSRKLHKQYTQYTQNFGRELSLSPQYKIKDDMTAFMSYVLSVNIAIKKFIEPDPPICPIIIDLWIIPNCVIDITNNGKKIENTIGNIRKRLRQNKIVFVDPPKKCNPQDINGFSQKILKCLSDKQKYLKENNLNRIIFIVDRRYKQKDTMYCILPPAPYSSTINKSLFLNHLYHNSNYLLPSITSGKSEEHIGSKTDLNGYIFNLSYLIFQYEPDNDKKQNHKSGQADNIDQDQN